MFDYLNPDTNKSSFEPAILGILRYGAYVLTIYLVIRSVRFFLEEAVLWTHLLRLLGREWGL